MLLPPSRHHHRSSTATISGARLRPALSPSPRSPPLLRVAIRSSMARREAAVSRMPALAHREVALALAGEVDARLGARLLPSAVPADVAEFGNRAGDALGSVDIRHGAPGSSIDFILESWLHRELPSGGAIDITSILAFLDASTDAPHFIMELIQGGPSSLVAILDLLPRRDLPLHPDYLHKYYHTPQLDRPRQAVEALPQARPYRSPSLFVRSVLSPTAVAVSIDCAGEGPRAMDAVVRGDVAAAAGEVLRVWLDGCAGSAAEMGKAERAAMAERDRVVKAKAVEVDLAANFPRMFDVSGRVVGEIRKAFGVQN